MNLQSYGSMMEQIGAAQQRWLDQASTSGTSSFAAFNAALQAQQAGTTSSASSAGSANTTTATTQTASTTAAATVPGQSPQDVNQAQLHHHHHHGGGGTGGLFGSGSMGALLGGQESTGSSTDEAGESGLFASISSAVDKAIASYFGSQNAAAANTTANASPA